MKTRFRLVSWKKYFAFKLNRTQQHKGQLINERKTSALVARAKFCKFFIRFLEESRFPKSLFEIN